GPMLERLEKAAPAGVTIAAMSRGIARVHTRTDDVSSATPANLQLVSPSYFPVLGASPAIGRSPPDSTHPVRGNSPVAVISYSYWQRRFAGAADVLGRTLTINGSLFTIVGVG